MFVNIQVKKIKHSTFYICSNLGYFQTYSINKGSRCVKKVSFISQNFDFIIAKKCTMIAAIKINEKQIGKLQRLIINQKLDFSIIETEKITPVIGGINLKVYVNVFSGDPGDLFTLGIKYKEIKDDIIM